jgi:FkbM family methyltransferase
MNINKIKKYITPQTILDIGANIGQFYNECKQSFPSSYIFSIEATKECEDELSKINSNYLITALYKEKTKLPFYKRKNDLTCSGNSIYRENTEFYNDENLQVEYISTELLDNLFTDDSSFDLIKIDTQGSELDIITGGINLCKKAKLILLEVSLIEYNEKQPLLNEVNEYMNNIGFEQVDIIGENYHPITRELIQYDILYKNKLFN